MAYVFYADKKRSTKIPKGISKTSSQSKNKTTVTEKKDTQSWGDTLGGVFKFIKWLDVNRIYRIFNLLPLPMLNGLGHLLGRLGFGSSTKVQRRIQASIRALYPDISKKKVKILANANTKYMGMFFINVLFRMPSMCDTPPNKIVPCLEYLNFEVLDKILETGKGVIIPILHIGQHFHNPGGIFMHPKRYKMSAIASIKNLPMYEYNNRHHYKNLFIYASTKFDKIKKPLERDLNRGHTLVVYHDYSSKGQLRVPFQVDKFPYLIHTPQSYISLHKRTGAEILPLITIPSNVFGKSKLFFLDNSSIMEVSRKYWNVHAKEFHGRLSTEINRIMYRYIRIYAPYWEEIMRFAGLRCGDKLEFPKNIEMKDLITQCIMKFDQILENSWEPNRKDEEMKNLLKMSFEKISKELKNPKMFAKDRKSFIDLSLLDAKSEITKILLVLLKILKDNKEDASYSLLSDLITKFRMEFF